MKKFTILILILCLSGCTQTCSEDSIACMKTEDIQMEENAVLTVSVEYEPYGEQLKKLWDTAYPEHKGALHYDVKSAADILNKFLEEKVIQQDVFLTKDVYVPTYFDSLMELDHQLFLQMELPPVERYYKQISAQKECYVPMHAEGMVFSYNETKLKQLGYDTTVMESFEAMSDMKEEQIYFHMNYAYHIYPLLTSTFSMFENENTTFRSRDFKTSLENYKELYQTMKLKDDPEHYDSFFIDQSYLSGLVSPWMQLSQSEKQNNSNLRFDKMPTWKGKQLSPISNSYGYVINANTPYPKAAQALLLLMRSIDGMNAYTSQDHIYPLIKEDQMHMLSYTDENQKEISKAYLYSRQQPLWGLKSNPSQNIMSVYENSDILSIISDYIDDKLTLEEAVRSIVEQELIYMKE